MAKVALCIATYRRPLGLERALQSVHRCLMEISHNTTEVTVVVVDNDKHASSAHIIERFSGRLHLKYEVEPVQGIARVRNRLVSIALQLSCEYIGFLDDDEVLDPMWLGSALAALELYQTDIVTGPVLPEYEPSIPEWVIKGRFFERASFASGTRMRWARTGNVLFRAHCFQGLDYPFHESLGLTGGEDTYLFARLTREGRTIVWCAEARVRETVPMSRASAKWIVLRSFRMGNTQALCDRLLSPTMTKITIRLAKGLLRMAGCAVVVGISLLLGRIGLVKALAYGAKGVGMVAGVFGVRYKEYETIHGR